MARVLIKVGGGIAGVLIASSLPNQKRSGLP